MPKPVAPGRAPFSNQLLAALPPREYERFLPHLEAVPLVFKEVLHQPGELVPYVYFPNNGVISLLISPAGRRGGVEVGVVGREGIAGLSIFLGVNSTPTRWVVQAPGDALRMRAEEFRARVGRGPLHDLLLLYTNAFLAQVSQSVVCNALHSLDKRLCRWVLMVHGRVGTDQFPLTHEFLAAMLGVQRASVTQAALGLQEAGVIRYRRGRLEVLDRAGLESAACGCHRAAQAELDRLPG